MPMGTSRPSDATSASDEVTGTDADSSGGEGTEGMALPCEDDPATCDAWFLPRGAR